MERSKVPLFLLLLLIPQLCCAQSSLQIEFERGYPLREEEGHPSSTSSSPSPFDNQTLPWRLPRDVWPLEYDLRISPILDDGVPGLGEDFTAPGEVTIIVKALAPTAQIKLHVGKECRVHGWEISSESTGERVVVDKAEPDEGPHQFFTFHLRSTLTVNETYMIWINFTSEVKDGLDGLYRSKYVEPETNVTKYIATTQMEALHARQMFPCFDEPAFKAVFYIVIGRKSTRTALANTQSTRNRTMSGVAGWVWEEFAPTVKMSTYLVALIVSEFGFEEAASSLYSKKVRTYAPTHYIEMGGGKYAAEMAAKMLAFYDDYYAEKYPLMKMDSAAVPDFFFGDRETALLYFPSESTETERYSITRILAHELGHQWFGNLISPSWWTHIWLNEGFATYLAAQGTEAVDATFESWERFQNDVVQYSMSFDARLDYSHSVKIDEVAWGTRNAMDWFDRIAYEKAGSLINMMAGFLSEPVLKEGLRAYLNAKQFDTAGQDELFHYLNNSAKAAGKIPNHLSMGDIMNSWTLQPGFPLIRYGLPGIFNARTIIVHRVSVDGDDGVYVSQERFTNNAAATLSVNQNSGLWHVPMLIACKSQPSPTTTYWLSKDTAMVRMDANPKEWMIFNYGANGYYRVLYDSALTNLIVSELASDKGFISAKTRSQLLDDYYSAAWQKYVGIESALSLTKYVGSEEAIVVWNTVLSHLRAPFNLLSGGGSSYAALRSFLLPRLQSATELTGGLEQVLPEQGGAATLRHLQFMDWLCAFEDAGCLEYSRKLVDAWRDSENIENNPIRRDIRPVAYCAAVSSGDEDVFDFIHKQYRNETTTTKQRGSLLNALACTKEIGRINMLLEETIKEEGFYVLPSHATTIMVQLARNPLGRTPTLRFLRTSNNTDVLLGRLGGAGISSVISSFAGYVSTRGELAEIESYLATYIQVPAQTNALRTIRNNIVWIDYFGAAMRDFFNANA